MAHERARREANVHHREERAARDESVRSDDSLVERVEVERQVVDAVMELDERYRRVVLLRYFESMSVRAIASADGISAETVKSRLRRAHQQLRGKLDRRFGGDGRSWVFALVPVAGRHARHVGAAAALPSTAVLLVSAGAAVGTALLGWFLWIRPGMDRTQAGLSATRGGTDAAVPGSPGDEDETTARVSELDARRPQSESAGSTERTWPETLRVTAVDARSGDPVPGATVTLVDSTVMQGEAFADLQLTRDFDAMFRRLGHAATGGDDGVVEIGWTGAGAMIQVEAPGLYSLREVGLDAEGALEVPLFVDGPVRVRAVDSAGQGVPGLTLRLGPPGRKGDGLLARTDAGGIARFPHGRALARQLEFVERAFVQVVAPGLEAVRVAVDLGEDRPVSSEPAELVLPSVGGVRIRAEGFERTPVLHLAEATDPTEPWRQLPVLPGANGVATFPAVGLGMELVARASGADGAAEVRLDGPRTTGEVVEAVLRKGSGESRIPAPPSVVPPVDPSDPFAAGPARLRAQLVHEDGSAVGAAQFRLRTRTASGSASAGGLTTEADGTFELELGMASDATDGARSPRTTIVLEQRENGPGLYAQIEAGPYPLGSTHELGSVVLRPRPLLASGRVADGEGESIPRARVAVERRIRLRSGAWSGWMPYADAFARTDRDGAFELYAVPADGSFRVVAESRGSKSRPSEVVPGAEDVVLEVLPMQSLAARVMDPRAWDLDGFRFLLEPADGDPSFEARRFGRVDEAGSIAFDGLLPGRYRLRVEVEGIVEDLDRPAFSIDAIDVEGPGPEDAPVLELDLARWFVQRTVSVRYENGDPYAGGLVWLRNEGTRSSYSGRTADAAGRVAVTARLGDVRTIKVDPLGGESIVREVTGDLELVLPDVLVVTLQLEADGPLRDRFRYLALRPRSEDPLRPFESSRKPDDEGRVELRLPGPGSYTFDWGVSSGSGSLTFRDLEGVEAEAIELDVTPGHEPLRVHVPDRVHAALLERLRL